MSLEQIMGVGVCHQQETCARQSSEKAFKKLLDMVYVVKWDLDGHTLKGGSLCVIRWKTTEPRSH